MVLLTAYMAGKYLHHDFKDAEVWYDAGRRVLKGWTLANLPHYRYPPTFAVLVAPLCALGFAPFYFAWYVINLWLFGAMVVLSMAGLGLVLGYGSDRVVRLLGIDLGRLEHHE